MKELIIAIINGLDIENIVAILALTVIAIVAMQGAEELPPVVNTIVGGIIGYLTRSYTENKKVSG